MKKILKKYIALVREDGTIYNKENIRTWNENERDLALAYLRSEGVDMTNFGNMQFPIYSLVKMTEYKTHGIVCTNKDYITSKLTLKKDTIEKYNLTEIDDYCEENSLWSIYRLIGDFHIPYINVRVDGIIKHYTNFSMFEKLVNAVNVEQQPLVMKGTDYPYWFNFEGKLIPSNTSSWFKYLQTKYNYIAPSSLISYTGDDMYDKHLTNK
jgi:hypothetical protein